MNPVLQAALLSIVRHFLTLLAGYLIKQGIWTEGDAMIYVQAGALTLIALGWSAYGTHRARLAKLIGLMLPTKAGEAGIDAVMKTVPMATTVSDVTHGK